MPHTLAWTISCASTVGDFPALSKWRIKHGEPVKTVELGGEVSLKIDLSE
jgi:hypothetical protein